VLKRMIAIMLMGMLVTMAIGLRPVNAGYPARASLWYPHQTRAEFDRAPRTRSSVGN